VLVAGGTTHADGPLVVGTVDHQRGMGMTVVALRRSFAYRVAIHATRMLQDATGLHEQRARAFRRIAKRRKGIGPAQILGAGERCGRGRQNDDDQTCFHRQDSLATSKADRRQSAIWVAATHRSCRRRHAFKNRVACSTKSSGYWWCAPGLESGEMICCAFGMFRCMMKEV